MNERILLAESDSSVRKMVSRVLETAGYRVTQAGTSAETAHGLQAARPDLVVWDLELGAPAGWEELDFKAEAERAIPVVGITAWPNQQERAARRGATVVLEKPLDLHLLLRIIRELLSGSPSSRAAGLAAAG